MDPLAVFEVYGDGVAQRAHVFELVAEGEVDVLCLAERLDIGEAPAAGEVDRPDSRQRGDVHHAAAMLDTDVGVVGGVMDFVVIVMLLAFDFWTVKNVSGRLLVGTPLASTSNFGPIQLNSGCG